MARSSVWSSPDIALPFSTSAPTGQTLMHFPQLVQVTESPQSSLRSVIMRAPMPRPVMSQVCAPSISSHTRMQRAEDASIMIGDETPVGPHRWHI